jgi:hypothetical protein
LAAVEADSVGGALILDVALARADALVLLDIEVFGADAKGDGVTRAVGDGVLDDDRV